MKVRVLPLSNVYGYVAKPIKKIYSTKYIGLAGLKRTANDYPGYFSPPSHRALALNKHGEIALTKACDKSLQHQASKLGCNAVLGTGYSFSIESNSVAMRSDTISAVSMYAYGEAVKLMPKD